MRYTKAEKIDMVFIYGECHQIVREAVRLYAERFPERAKPSRSVFINIIRNFEETGNVDNKTRKRFKTATNSRNTENILKTVAQNPHLSSRQLAHVSGISQRSILRILHLNQFQPLHVSCHQELHGNDFQNRVNFCKWGLRKLQDDDTFLTKILFSDEATFTNSAQVNRHNCWSIENPLWLQEVDKQRPWSVNIWCGLINDKIIGPHFIDGTSNTRKYQQILTEILPQLLEDIPLHMRKSMWFQHEECPAHSARIITNILNRSFGDRWTGRAGNQKWPERSPDLTPLHFYLWRKLKQQVYGEIPTTKEEMKQRITRACSTINPNEIQCAVLSLSQRFRACIDAQGHYVD